MGIGLQEETRDGVVGRDMRSSYPKTAINERH